MAKPVEYKTLEVASIYSGFLMCQDFGDMHKAVEDLMGGAVFTHQIPNSCEELRPYIADFSPEIAAFDFSKVNRDTVADACKRLVGEAGETVTLRTPMISSYSPDPKRDLPRDMPLTVITPKVVKDSKK